MKNIYPIILFLLSIVISYSQELKPIDKQSQQAVPLSIGQVFDYNEQYESLNYAPSPTGNSTEPGNTPGELDVTASGGASYTIPIQVPEGINGVHPELFLTYNSQSGNGTAGYGWNVGSISTISRTTKTMFHNEEVKGVNYEDDQFTLDGERLMLVSGTYGMSNSVYETENESNVRVKAIGCRWHGGLNNGQGACMGPSTFQVYYPDGSVAVYGLVGNDGTFNLNHQSYNNESWAISYYMTPSGNKVSYHYLIDNRALYIQKIRYSYTGTNHLSEIEFKYEDKQRSEFYYIREQKFINRKILKEINVKNNGQGYRNYVLAHDTNSGDYERLISLTEISGNGEKSYNPTRFTYFNNVSSNNLSANYETYTSGFTSINKYNAVAIPGDFTGNGVIDNVFYDLNNKNKYFYRNDFFGQPQYSEVNTGSFREIFPVNSLNPSEKLMPNEVICIIRGHNNTNMTFRVDGVSGSAITGNNFINLYNKTHTFRQVTALTYNPFECGDDWEDDGGLPIIPHSDSPELTINPSPGTIGPIRPPTNPEDPQDPENPGSILQPIPGGGSTQKINIPKTYLSGDFNGDGLSDIVVLEREMNYQDVTCVDGQLVYTQRQIMPRTYLVELDRRKNTNFVSNAGFIRNVRSTSKIYTADYTGDGKTDVLLYHNNRILIYNYSNITNRFEQVKRFPSYNGYWDANIIKAMADGYPILLGDYNGDGTTDICVPDDNNSMKWHFYFSTRNGAFEKNTKPNLLLFLKNGGGAIRDTNYFSIDINQDGKSDLVRLNTFRSNFIPFTNFIYYTDLTVLENKIAHNNNLNFDSEEINVNLSDYNFHISSGNNPLSKPLVLISNEYNSNRIPEIKMIQDGEILVFKSQKNHQEEMLLRQITRGNGIKETIYYNPLENDNFFSPTYISNFQEVFPNVSMNYNKQMKVVKQLRINAYDGYQKHQDFRYREAVINTEGLGFLGFKALHRSNWYNDDIQKFTSISEYDTSLRGALVRSFTVQFDVENSLGLAINQISQIVSYSKSEYFSELNANGVYSLKLLKNVEADKLKDVLVYNENIIFDSYNNIKENKNRIYSYTNNFNITNPPTNYVQETISKLTFENVSNLSSTNFYYIGKPLTKETEIRINNPSYTSVMIEYNEFNYNDQLLIDEFTYWRGNSDKVKEKNEYDSYGNLILKRLITENDGERINEFIYDPTYRFVEESIDISGTSTYYNYNPTTELLTSEMDNLGNEITYVYDVWGNILVEYKPFGVTVFHDYQLLSNQRLQKSVYTNEGKDQRVILDALGREIEKSTKNFEGNFSKIRTVYNDNDLAIEVSEPFFVSPSYWNIIEYDMYGRPKDVNYASGKNISFAYNGLEVIEDDGVNVKTTIKNQLGQVISLNDNGGTVLYQYNADGTLKQSNYAGNVIISFEYDDWGRKTKMIDPSAGTYEYEYNQFGEITIETTPNGITTYDYFTSGIFNGLLNEENIVGIGNNTQISKNYIYNPNTKLIASVDMFDFENNIESIYEYSYDTSGRLLEIVETLHDGVSFKKNIDYGDFGQIDHIYYESEINTITSNLQVDYHYVFGTLTEIRTPAESIPLWSLNEVDVRGNAIDYVYGNGISASIEFDEFGYPFKNKQESNGLKVLDFEYDFDTTRGILQSRSSVNTLWGDWKETFNHDNQNQLTLAEQELIGSSNNFETLENEYDSKARITRNEQVGDYNYNSNGKPYQLEKINLNPEAADKYWAKHRQQISYNAFKSPSQIVEFFDFQDINDKEVINFTYNAFNQRSARYYNWNPSTESHQSIKYYSGIAPIEIKQDLISGKSTVVYFIGGDEYQAPVAFEDAYLGNTQLSHRFLYLHRDYLGTIFAITSGTNSIGSVGIGGIGGVGSTLNGPILVERRHFDAWGGLVMLQSQGDNEAAFFEESSFDTELYLDRGYTGHEHLASVSLIHMNGRMYDAKLRRFLAPDNFIQDPYNTQNFNRYAYVYNNPLIYNDPSGELKNILESVWDFAKEAWSFTAHTMLGIYGIIGFFEGTLNITKWSDTGKFAFGASVFLAGGVVGFAIGGAAIKAGIIAGSLNAAYNFDGEFNLQLLGYFSAGFIGGYAGTAFKSVYWGMAIGGAANVGAAFGANDIKGSGTLYQIGQKFMGGALSSLAGMNVAKMKGAQYIGEMTGLGKYKIVDGIKSKAKYLFKSKVLDKGLFYGLQSLGADFAYMDKKKFGKQAWYNHFFSFSIGAFNGFIHTDKNLNFGHSLLGYAGFDYGLKIINQGYDPYTYKYRDQKVGIFSLKTIPLLFR